ncbi:hypothetical protein [Streptomyces solicathayae]|uniref:DUF3592 domain-containing protein n=1 Tax=Streptomyces solicathayae TaxID=3081768 RepID=A0ABZ0LWC8_9ACTN|nr:hypothetical protein [Streptomyces sp. HUAS YS2]WOX23496.1 hypothetical protein R2D22_19770 [Streptomyces sp. HUAS YS2]
MRRVVSAAAATLFADRVNAMLPERATGEGEVDGTTLVVTRSLRIAAAAQDELEDDWLLSAGRKRAGYAAVAAMALFAVAAGFVGRDPSRAIAVLLLGEVGVGIAFHASHDFPGLWRLWYLPRHGITVDAQQVFRNGYTTNAYVDSDGVTRYIRGSDKGRPIRVAYHPQKPEIAVRCPGPGSMRSQVIWFLVISAFAASFLYGAYALALPAFGV